MIGSRCLILEQIYLLRSNMKILWLASWYPNELLPLNGDFVQRHAKAVSLRNEVTVINITRDKKKLITGSIKKTSFTAGQPKEKIIYYHTPQIFIRLKSRVELWFYPSEIEIMPFRYIPMGRNLSLFALIAKFIL